jgi:hypothetical protein
MRGDSNGGFGIVFGDAGGWLSGPMIRQDEMGDRRFGHNVGGWMEAYPEYVLQGERTGAGFVAWRRGPNGRATGTPMKAETLDELACLVDRHKQVQEPPSGE